MRTLLALLLLALALLSLPAPALARCPAGTVNCGYYCGREC